MRIFSNNASELQIDAVSKFATKRNGEEIVLSEIAPVEKGTRKGRRGNGLTKQPKGLKRC